MKKLKIYVETTLFNYYFDSDREAHLATVNLFENFANGKFEPYTSDYVIDELQRAPEQKRDKMLSLIEKYSIKVLDFSPEAERLADIYVNQGVIPLKYLTDGIHIAIASVCGLDVIVSLNFKHIVKRKTKIEASLVNQANNYRTIDICTPMEVIEDEQ